MFEPMESVETVNNFTVKVRMSRPVASFPLMMTLVSNSILPKHVLEQKPDLKFDVMGTGPWKLKNFISGAMRLQVLAYCVRNFAEPRSAALNASAWSAQVSLSFSAASCETTSTPRF